MSENKLVQKGKKIVKTFSSRSSFVKETSIYEKLKGTGLAPELLLSCDGEIEREYIDAPSFMDVLIASANFPAGQLQLYNQFIDWYKKYRELTKLSMGDVDFSDFFVCRDGLKCVDFEHTRPGYTERDLARLAAYLCIYPEGYSSSGMENARAFISSVAAVIDIDYTRLSDEFPVQMDSLCEKYGFERMAAADEYVRTGISCAGIVIAGDKRVRINIDKDNGSNILLSIASMVASMPQRVLLTSPVSKAEAIGFVSVSGIEGNTVENFISCLKAVNTVWALFVPCNVPKLSEKILRQLLSAPKAGFDMVFFTEKGQARKYPFLVKRRKALEILRDAGIQGIESMWKALLSETRNASVEISDIKGYEEGMLDFEV